MTKITSDVVDLWENEPIIHSHVTDGFTDERAKQFITVRCLQCDGLVHWGDECMQAWAETDSGPICLQCLTPIMNCEGEA